MQVNGGAGGAEIEGVRSPAGGGDWEGRCRQWVAHGGAGSGGRKRTKERGRGVVRGLGEKQGKRKKKKKEGRRKREKGKREEEKRKSERKK